LLHVLDFRAVVSGAIEGRIVQLAVWNRNAEARAKDLQLIVIQLFLLVRDVLAFARFAESVALDGLGENDGGRPGVLDRSLVRGVHFDRVVASEAHAGELLVRKMFDHLQQAGISAEKILPEIRAALDEIFLILSVGNFAHAADEQAIAIGLNERIPIAAPDDLDDVPSRAAENRFQLLDDLAVAAHWSVEALQIAVDDENQVVEALARSQRDRAERLRFVHFAIAQERPDFAASGGFQAAIFKVLDEARVVDRLNRTQSHGHGREFPEVGHEPGMRIRGKSAARFQFTAEVLQFFFGDAAFKIGARVHSGRGVSLEIDNIAVAGFGGCVKKMI